MKEDFVSVIVPTHNRAHLLSRAIDSILYQNYRNIEIIVVVDACSDNTLEVLKQYNDERIKIIVSEQNLGGAGARNKGMKEAKGKYIAFLDDDDEWLPGKLTKQINLLKQNDNTVLVASAFIQFGDVKKQVIKLPEIITLKELYYKNYIGSFSFCLVRANKLKGLFINGNLTACQDWDLWIKLLDSSGQIARCINEPLVVYHTNHDNRISSNLKNIVNARILFLRSHWNNMISKQKYFQLYELIKMKRILLLKHNTYFYNMKMYLKALKFYKKSGYDQKAYSYLLFITKLLNYS